MSEADADHGGTSTTLPLSDDARKGLQKNIRRGRVFQFFAVLFTGGIIAGTIAGRNAAPVVFLPVAGILAWGYFTNTVQARRDLRTGTIVRYQGPWRERTEIRSTRSGSSYRLYVQLPNLTEPVLIRRSALAKSVRQAGVGDMWSDSGGQLEYTSCSQQPLTYSRRPAG